MTNERKAAAAAQLLESEAFRDGFEAIQANIVAKFAQPGLNADQLHELYHANLAHQRLRRYWEQVVVTGKMDAIAEAQVKATKRGK